MAMGSRPIRPSPSAAVGPAPSPCPKRSRRRLFFLSAALLCALLFATRRPILIGIARFVDVSEPPQGVDYLLVLAGSNDTRPFVAAGIFKAGLATKIVITRPSPDPEA